MKTEIRKKQFRVHFTLSSATKAEALELLEAVPKAELPTVISDLIQFAATHRRQMRENPSGVVAVGYSRDATPPSSEPSGGTTQQSSTRRPTGHAKSALREAFGPKQSPAPTTEH